MALQNYKIESYKNPVSSLPDRPSDIGMTATQLKAAFDANATDEIKSAINAIIDDLDGLQGEIVGFRIDAEGEIEYSLDGESWICPAKKKVDKVEGKGLSTNDYDNDEKGKVADSYILRHSHNNKVVIDGISESDVSNWNSSYSKEHMHNNKVDLDMLSQEKMTFWDNKVEYQNVITKNSTEDFTPTIGTQPTNKKYVDEAILAAVFDSGKADMTKIIYDPTGKETDVYEYSKMQTIISALSDFSTLETLLGSGYKYMAQKGSDGWEETVTDVANNTVFAQKNSRKDESGKWIIETQCSSLGVNTVFEMTNNNGNWEGVITNG